MKKLFLVTAASLCAAQTPEAIEKELDNVARIASVMVDGDACQRIMTKRATDLMFAENPRDRYAASDNYDVNHEPFIQVKKTLLRLAMLCPFACDVNLWMPLQRPGKIHVVIRNTHEMSQFWPWGALHQDTPAPMKTVLESGRRVTAKEKPGWVSVLAPVTNSLGETVGLVEVVAPLRANPRENVK